MKKYIIYILVMFLSYSCGITESTRKAMDLAFSSTIVTQKAMSKILVETTMSIFQKDSLEPNMPIYIHFLKASFTNESYSFELEIDSVKAIWINDTTMLFNKVVIVEDTIVYNQVAIPQYNSYLGADTLLVTVICKYLPNIDFATIEDNLKCLTADYIIQKQIITIKDEFKRCAVNTSEYN
jgi:hypothetical protein